MSDQITIHDAVALLSAWIDHHRSLVLRLPDGEADPHRNAVANYRMVKRAIEDHLEAHSCATKPVVAHAEPLDAPQSEPGLIVRDFSVVGPCIPLGPLVKRSAKSLWYRDRDGAVRRLGGWRVARGLVHTEPCVSCRDHERTQYPDGYMD